MKNYKCSEKKITTEGREYLTYGIEYRKSGERRCIEDISTDRKAVEEFIGRLNDGDASEVHIRELVEDFIAAM